jgi:hypothetical protein
MFQRVLRSAAGVFFGSWIGQYIASNYIVLDGRDPSILACIIGAFGMALVTMGTETLKRKR